MSKVKRVRRVSAVETLELVIDQWVTFANPQDDGAKAKDSLRGLEEQLEVYGSWLQEIVSLHHEGGDGAHVCHYAVLAQKALDGVPFPASDPFDAGGQVTHVHVPASRSS